MNEQEIFRQILDRIIKDWRKTSDAIFSKIGKESRKSYTYAYDLFNKL